MVLRFDFFEEESLQDLSDTLVEYCRQQGIGTKHRVIKIYNHSVTAKQWDNDEGQYYDTLLNKVMVVWDDE